MEKTGEIKAGVTPPEDRAKEGTKKAATRDTTRELQQEHPISRFIDKVANKPQR